MKAFLVSTVVLGMTLSGAAFAQTPAGSAPHQAPSQPAGSQTNAAPPNGPSANTILTANRLVQDLQKSGLTDVRVVAEAFVVQAKTKDGEPVVMTVGPHGMTAFEPIPGASTTGSTRQTTGSSGATNQSGSMGAASHK